MAVLPAGASGVLTVRRVSLCGSKPASSLDGVSLMCGSKPARSLDGGVSLCGFKPATVWTERSILICGPMRVW